MTLGQSTNIGMGRRSGDNGLLGVGIGGPVNDTRMHCSGTAGSRVGDFGSAGIWEWDL